MFRIFGNKSNTIDHLYYKNWQKQAITMHDCTTVIILFCVIKTYSYYIFVHA